MPRLMLALLLATCCLAEDPAPPAAAAPAAGAPPAAAPAPVQPADDSPLTPVRTENPRQTMRTFMVAMDRYATAVAGGDLAARTWLDDAVRCFDLSRTNPVGRDAAGREAAIYLKETIDRVIRVDLERVPADAAVDRWRLRDTEITIWRVTDGDRRGEHLFTPDTVERAKHFFGKVASRPLLPGTLGGGWTQPWQEHFIPESLKPEVFGVAYWQWTLMAVLIFAGLLMRHVARLAAFILKRITARTAATWDDELVEALTGPVTHLATTGVWFASLHLLGITGAAYTVIAFLIKGAFFVNLGYLAYQIAGFLGHLLEHRMRASGKDVNQSLFKLLRQTMQLLAMLFCLLLGAQNMGMDVASLIAGLGIGGLAFALAAKDTLANLFGSIMIMLDRPFRVGDYIVAKGAEGTVEEVGFRCTRIRTAANSLTSMPNSELVMANIDNLGMRTHRRVRETLSLTYDTPPERITAFCDGVRAILVANPAVKQDAIVVAFSTMAASSLDVLVNYHLASPTWDHELAQRQANLLEILRLAERLQVAFAFPTQTLHIGSLPPVPAAGGTCPAGDAVDRAQPTAAPII